MVTDHSTMPRIVVYICPQSRCDIVPHAFYRDAAPDLLLDVRHEPITSYDVTQGRRILEGLDHGLLRDPENTAQVVIGGSALSLSYRWPELVAAAEAVSRRVGVDVVTDMMLLVSQLAELPMPIAVAHRLAGVSDAHLVDFFASAGIACEGVISAAADPEHNGRMSLADSSEEAVRLSELTMESHPDARTLVLLGGTWWTQAAQQLIESTGRHVVTNVGAITHAHRRAAQPARATSTDRGRSHA
jgi:hypothetical protein